MTSSETSITILIATYERAEWLAVALRSIQLSAQFAELCGVTTRIVVVDDGSPTERTSEVARALGVQYIRNSENDGRNDPSAARVLGLSRVDTPYYAFFDDDDVMLPRWIVAHVEAIHAGFDVAYSAYLVTDAELRPRRRIVPYQVHLGDLLANHNAVNDHCLVSTEKGRPVWDDRLEKAMMFGGWLELAYQGASFVRISEPTYFYRRHHANMSDEVDPRFTELRAELVARYRAQVLDRDGYIPGPSARLRARRRIAPLMRIALRLGRGVRGTRAR